jgi:hypothetical protein
MQVPILIIYGEKRPYRFSGQPYSSPARRSEILNKRELNIIAI